MWNQLTWFCCSYFKQVKNQSKKRCNFTTQMLRISFSARHLWLRNQDQFHLWSCEKQEWALKEFCTLRVVPCVQWDQMHKYFWPFLTMKMCPMVQKFTKVGSKFGQMPNKPETNYYTFLILPKWPVFAKFGHTVMRVRALNEQF